MPQLGLRSDQDLDRLLGALARIKTASAMGLRVENASFDYAVMSDRKDQVIQKLRNGIKSLLKANGVTVFQGSASFQSRNKILVEPSTPGGEPTVLSAGKTSFPQVLRPPCGLLPKYEP